jgi:hypothetical protein
MPLPPTLEWFLQGHPRALEACLGKGLALPAVVLICIVTDSFAFLARPTEEVKAGPHYESWVKDYLLGGHDGRAASPEEIARPTFGMIRYQNQPTLSHPWDRQETGQRQSPAPPAPGHTARTPSANPLHWWRGVRVGSKESVPESPQAQRVFPRGRRRVWRFPQRHGL